MTTAAAWHLSPSQSQGVSGYTQPRASLLLLLLMLTAACRPWMTRADVGLTCLLPQQTAARRLCKRKPSSRGLRSSGCSYLQPDCCWSGCRVLWMVRKKAAGLSISVGAVASLNMAGFGAVHCVHSSMQSRTGVFSLEDRQAGRIAGTCLYHRLMATGVPSSQTTAVLSPCRLHRLYHWPGLSTCCIGFGYLRMQHSAVEGG